MSLMFYGAPMSTASITEAVLVELGVVFTHVPIAIGAGDTRTPAFLALNPNGRVPVIVHDGTPIWESAAITMYLGEMFGVDAGLYPPPGPRRGEAMKWIVWANVNVAEAAGRLAAAMPAGSEGAVEPASRDWIAEDQRSAGAAAVARADLAACLTILDGELARGPFVLGDYTLVDTHLQGFVGWVASMDVHLSPWPHVAAWLERCSQRPALAGRRDG